MVALKPPFEATNHLALAKKIINGSIERIPDRYSEDLQQQIQWMLSTDPEKRPSVDELIVNPKIKLRLSERDMKAEYQVLKDREQLVKQQTEAIKNKEQQLILKEEELKQREEKAQQMKLKLSMAKIQKQNSALYSSMENNAGFEKILDDKGRQFVNPQVNFSQKFPNGTGGFKEISKDKSLKNL